MKYLSIALKQLRSGKVIAVLAVALLTAAVAVMNINLSVVRKFFTVPMVTSKLNDPNLYAVSVNRAYLNSLSGSATAEEAERYLQELNDGYCAEQGLSSIEESPLSADELEFDLYRYDREHPELGNPSLVPIYSPGLWEAMEQCPCISKISCFYDQRFLTQKLEKDGHCLSCAYVKYMDTPLISRLDYHLLCGRKPAEDSETEALLELQCAPDKSAGKAFLGESVEMRVYNFETKQYETRTATIVGVTDSPHYQYQSYQCVSSDLDSIMNLFTRTTLEPSSIEDADCCGQLLMNTPAGYDGIAHLSGPSVLSYITVKKGTSDAEIQRMRQEFQDRRFEVASMHDAYQKTMQYHFKYFADDASIIVVSALLALVLIVVVIRWQIGRSRQQQYIFMLAGASKKDQRRIVEWYLLVLHLLAMITSGLFLFFWTKHLHAAERDLFGIYIDGQNVVLMLALLLVSYLVGRLTVRLSFSKYSQTGMMQK